jgi:glucitol operon activator protein
VQFTQFTNLALVLLLIGWSLQVCGSWIQWRHFQSALAVATKDFADGYLGIGRSRPPFGFGTVVLLVIGPDLRVRRLQTMAGLSVFARLRDQPQYEGLHLQALEARLGQSSVAPRLAAAARQAIRQIEEVRARKQP